MGHMKGFFRKWLIVDIDGKFLGLQTDSFSSSYPILLFVCRSCKGILRRKEKDKDTFRFEFGGLWLFYGENIFVN